jgi:hypothetical protein
VPELHLSSFLRQLISSTDFKVSDLGEAPSNRIGD